MPVEVKTAGELPIILEEYVEYNPHFEKEDRRMLVEVQDCRKITDHFRGICRI